MKTIATIIGIGLASVIFLSNCAEDIDEFKHLRVEIPTIENIDFTRAEQSANVKINDWGFKFFKSSYENYIPGGGDNGNMSVSPLSASLALTLLANSGDMATEEAVLQMMDETNISSLNNTMNKLMRYLPYDKNKDVIKLANSIWYQNDMTPDNEWESTLNSTLYPLIRPIDFGDKKNVDIINNWCAANTNGMIPEIVKELDASTEIIFMNALYFEGAWANKFDKSETSPAVFYGKDEENQVQMMHLKTDMQYHEFGNFNAVKLQFEGENQMILLLPAEGVTPEQVINDLDRAVLEDFYPGKTIENEDGYIEEYLYRVDLFLPRFNISSSLDITSTMRSFGLPKYSNLDKMGVEQYIKTDILQKTATTIDEGGAKAAAVTIIQGEGALPINYLDVTMNFNRPFIYFIRNNHTGSILMAGVINNL